MNDRSIRLVLVSLSAVVLGSGCSGLRRGTPAPDFELRNLTGQQVSLSQYRGVPVVLSYFTTW